MELSCSDQLTGPHINYYAHIIDSRVKGLVTRINTLLNIKWLGVPVRVINLHYVKVLIGATSKELSSSFL